MLLLIAVGAFVRVQSFNSVGVRGSLFVGLSLILGNYWLWWLICLAYGTGLLFCD